MKKSQTFPLLPERNYLTKRLNHGQINFPEYEQLTERFIQIGRSINAIARLSTQVGNISQQDFIELGQLMTQLMEELEKELSVKVKKKSTKH
jgi:hypothetical protein